MKNSVLIRNMVSTMIAALLFVLLASLAQADELTVENNTGRAIVELAISQPGANAWSDNLLPVDTALTVGEAVSIPLADNVESGDLRALLDNGSQELYSSIYLHGLSHLKLSQGGTVVAE